MAQLKWRPATKSLLSPSGRRRAAILASAAALCALAVPFAAAGGTARAASAEVTGAASAPSAASPTSAASSTTTTTAAVPRVTKTSLTSSVLPATGGTTTLQVDVVNARTCWLTGMAGLTVSGAHQDCRGGTFTATLQVAPNDSLQLAHLHVGVTVAGTSGNPVSAYVYLLEEPLAPLKVTSQPSADYRVGHPFKFKLSAQGGLRPYTWELTSGTLPQGLSLSPGGAIYGTPVTPGTITLNLEVTDSSKPQAFDSATTLALDITPAPLVITTRSLPKGATQSLYTVSFEATGGVMPYSWRQLTGQLPPGLSLNSAGVLTGTPTGGGTYRFEVQVSDSASPAETSTASYSLRVVTPPLLIDSKSVPRATVGTVYSMQLVASGGIPPYEWTLRSGQLPAGISLNSAGVLSGTPTVTGSFTFHVKVSDSSATPLAAYFPYRIVVVPVPLSITTLTLPSGTVGTTYSATLSATGGAAPYFWRLTGGALPGGVQLSSGGTLSGTPVQPGTYHFSVKANDSSSKPLSVSASYTIEIAPISLLVATTGLPAASIGNPYAAALETAGGTAPFKWLMTSGRLPSGIVMSSAGYITGVTRAAGAYTFTVRVTDSSPAQQTAVATLTLLVGDGATNWSGYVKTGKYTEVAGTFVVPTTVGQPQAGSSSCQGSCGAVAEWVGLDGTAGTNAALIEAGVTEQSSGGYTPFWEILPAHKTNVVIAMTINPGDKVTVTIFKIGAGVWAIALDDDTTGQVFRTEQAYKGPATTADFVVEAPETTKTSPPSVLPLASFSPPIDFTNLQTVGKTVSRAALVLVQAGVQVSTPSVDTATGFAVGYGSIAPPPA